MDRAISPALTGPAPGASPSAAPSGPSGASGAVSGANMDRVVARRSPWRRRALLAVPALAVVAVLGWLLLTTGTERSVSVGARSLSISPVTRGQFDDFVQLRGQVIPLRTIFVDTSQGGQVEAIHVEDGAMVERGQLLIQLSNTALQLDLISREAQITEQLNNLRGLELAHEQSRLNSRREIVETEYQIERLTRQTERARALVAEGGAPRAELEDGSDELAYYKKRLVVLRESQGAARRWRAWRSASRSSSSTTAISSARRPTPRACRAPTRWPSPTISTTPSSPACRARSSRSCKRSGRARWARRRASRASRPPRLQF